MRSAWSDRRPKADHLHLSRALALARVTVALAAIALALLLQLAETGRQLLPVGGLGFEPMGYGSQEETPRFQISAFRFQISDSRLRT